MHPNVDYKGFRIILRDEDSGETITESTILFFLRDEMTIRVRTKNDVLFPYKRISVLVLTPNGVHEYLGTPRRGGSFHETEISLFKGKLKEDRGAPRYELNAPATIQFLSARNPAVTISGKMSITILNISTTGALILANAISLFLDHPFTLMIPMGEGEMVVHGKIIRDQLAPVDKMRSYGCRFIVSEELKNDGEEA